MLLHVSDQCYRCPTVSNFICALCCETMASLKPVHRHLLIPSRTAAEAEAVNVQLTPTSVPTSVSKHAESWVHPTPTSSHERRLMLLLCAQMAWRMSSRGSLAASRAAVVISGLSSRW